MDDTEPSICATKYGVFSLLGFCLINVWIAIYGGELYYVLEFDYGRGF